MARVLIVDDSFVARKALRKIISELGHTVVGEASDGGQALSEYAVHRPDLVTMDLAMPGMSGSECTTKILEKYPDARIIVVSASEERGIILDALERGARHYILKPVAPDMAAAAITNVLQQNIDQQKYKELVRRFKEGDALPEERRNGNEAVNGGGASVMIVDDSAVARKALREIVTALGHTVVSEATNGSQAFVEYTRCKPDVVTMDLTMEGMNGAEATSKIIATFSEARIIVISAIEERRVVIDALERGARHFIIKPITREKVAAVLGNVLRQQFDHQKHQEMVRKLKEAEGAADVPWAKHYTPPYRISRDNNLTMVEIGATLSLTSYQSLCTELEEYLTDDPLILFDFGSIAMLNEAVLAELEQLIQRIERNSGKVKAASRSKAFADSVLDGKAPFLASVLRYIPR